jgi:hypothetical protein
MNEFVFEMEFDGEMCSDPTSINSGWESFFEKVYTPSQNDNFNKDYLSKCEKELEDIFGSSEN